MITIEQVRTLTTDNIYIALRQRKSLRPEVVAIYCTVLHERWEAKDDGLRAAEIATGVE